MAVIKQNDKYGLINSKGRVVVEPKWDYILGESEGVYPVELDSLWGYIDRKGNVIIEPKYWDADFLTKATLVLEIQVRNMDLLIKRVTQ